MQNFRNQSLKQIQQKLSQHRDEGINSALTIFQVAYLLDVLERGSTDVEMVYPELFCISLN